MRLTLCRCCRRHMKLADAICPFCGVQRASSTSAGFVLAMAVGVGTLAACGGSTETGDGNGGEGGSPDKDAAADSAEDTGQGGMAGADAAYGPPPWDAADEGPVAAYGPAPIDAGDEAMSGAYGPPPDASAGGAYGPPPM